MPLKDAYLIGVLAQLPEADRAAAEAKLIALEDGGLRQADYSRQSAEAQELKRKSEELHAANVEWYETRKADLAELDTLRTRLAAAEVEKPITHPLDLPKDLITKADLTAQLDTMERGAVGFFTDLNALSLQHFQQFGEVLDTSKLLQDKRVQQIGLRGVYSDTFKDQLKAKADAAQSARDEAIREEGRLAERTRLAGQSHPYPVVGNEPSALDAIEAARNGQQPKVGTVDDMVAEYARLSATRSGTSGLV